MGIRGGGGRQAGERREAEREMISAVRKRGTRVSGELPWMGGEVGARNDRRRPME